MTEPELISKLLRGAWHRAACLAWCAACIARSRTPSPWIAVFAVGLFLAGCASGSAPDTQSGTGGEITLSTNAVDPGATGEPSDAAATSTSTTEAVTTTTTTPEVRRSLTSMLRLVPNSGKFRTSVRFTDFARIRDAFEITRPASGDDSVAAYLKALAEDARFGLKFGGFFSVGATPEGIEEWSRVFGYSVLDAGQDLQVGGNVNPVHLAAVSTPQAEIRAALDSDSVWAPLLAETEYEGLRYFKWADDPLAIDMDRASPLRLLGRGGTLALIDDVAVRAADPTDIEAVIAAAAGLDETLMDDPDFAIAAEELERRDVYFAEFEFWDPQRSLRAPINEKIEIQRRLNRLPLLPRSQVVATGNAIDDNGSSLVIIVYVTQSPADAAWATQVASANFVTELSSAGTLRELLTVGKTGIVVIEREFSEDARLLWARRQFLLYRSE